MPIDWAKLFSNQAVVSFLESVVKAMGDSESAVSGSASLSGRIDWTEESNSMVLEVLKNQGVLEGPDGLKKADSDSFRSADLRGRFRFTVKAVEALRGRVGLILALHRELKEMGYEVELGGVMAGVKGPPHAFDILATHRSGGAKVPIEVRTSGEGEEPVDAQAIFEIQAKLMKTQRTALVVVRPHASEDARKLAKAYGMTLIEGTEVAQIADGISRTLG